MSIQLIKKNQGTLRKISESYTVANFLTRDSSKNVSLAIGSAKNHSENTKNAGSDRIYYVLEGKLLVKQDNKEYTAEIGDTIFIPKDTKYHFEGTFKAILINSPAFNKNNEVISK